MEIKSQVKFIRMSSRKVELVIEMLRKKSVTDAENILRFSKKLAAKPVAKLLKAAVADAEHNFKLSKENLFVKSIVVGQGTSLKRWRPRAFGRAAPIKKHTCHVSIVLEDKVKNK
ncbi:MAG TPA: 50S ribosomal protein L22 [Candidatus Magasanikbacteria bacterium]|nr:50S ribosomal protein L22 [Candidatus Magasanikbacteria bacterium]